jgi:TonB-linked SusC/RagA family outer membrane protein
MKPRQTRKLLFLIAILACSTTLQAQTTIRGRITDAASKMPVPGVTVISREKAQMAATTANGEFSISVGAGDVLTITSIGYEPVTVNADRAFLEIILAPATKQLSDVVVTALGVRKETKKIGYAVQEVRGTELLKAREPNPINGLVGKVAGLTVGASSEMMQGPQLLLRGKGISLFVVDGVPINSDTWNINPDDVESYTVLKGATAAALYGYRGQNGAIMITTKRGSRDKRGFSIEFNSSTMFEKGFNAIPKVQDEYGPGDHGKYAFVDGKGGGTNDGDYDVWGPKFEGQLIPQYDSPVDPVTGIRQGTPWIARGKDNLKRFLETGILSTNNIAVAAKDDKYDLRFSLTNVFQKAIVPNMKMNANNFNVSGGYNFSNKLRLESYLNYNRQSSPNFPDVAYGPNSLIYNIVIWGGADWNIDDMRNYWQPGKEGVQSIYAEYQRYHNPYFVVNEWLRGHHKNDLNGNVKLSYTFNKNWDFFVRSQVTTYDLFRNEKMPFSAHPYGREEGRGDYREDKRNLFENNTDVLLTYTNNNFGNGFSVKTSAGANARNFRYNSSFVTTDYLNVPDLYTFANSRNPLRATSFTSNMLVLSAYSYVDFSIKKYANLSLTGRVDKISTLRADNRNIFYPSASFSTVLTDYLHLPSAFSFLKLRGSYANVRGALTRETIGATPLASYPIGYGFEYYSSYDGPTYENSNSYTTPLVYDKSVGAYYTDVLANPGLVSEASSTYDAGIEVRLLKSRLNFDVTYFIEEVGPRIFNLQRSGATGYNASKENGITTEKKGWEVSLNGSPLRTKNLAWNTTINWSTFKEELTAIYGNITELNNFLKIGTRYDQLIGSQFIRTPDGQIINDAGGRPIRNPKPQFLGYTNPDWVWSFINNVNYKNLSLGFQFDGRVGGTMINYIQQQTYRGGRHINTVEGAMGEARLQDYKGVKSWIGEGVVISNSAPIQYDNFGNVTNYKDMQFAPNKTATYLQDYISFFYNTNEANLISKTFAKLREVTLTYNLTSLLGNRSPFQQASVSLVGRNLLYFSKYKDVDIDQYAGSQGSSSLQTPTTKRYGINLNLTF